MSIRAKLIVAVGASMLALAVVTAVLVRAAGERNIRIAAEQAVAAAGQALAAAERADVDMLDATLRALAAHPGLAEAYAARDRARLLALAEPVFVALRDDHGVTHLNFIDPPPRRTMFLRVQRPGQHGDVVSRATLARAIETGTVAAGKELGMTAFALRVVRPWSRKGGELLGYLELAEDMDHFLDRMKAQTGDDYALVVEKSFLDEGAWASMRRGGRNDWADRPRTVVVDATADGAAMAAAEPDAGSLPEGGLLLDEQFRDGRRLARGIVPVKDVAGRRVGALFVLHDITALHASMLSARRGLYAAFAAVAAGLSALLLVLVNRLVLRRLDRVIGMMQQASTRLAAGDYDVAVPPPASRDEIGRFELRFGRFVRSVAELLKRLGKPR
jgi:HAMP domain-containing protein